MSIVCIEKRLSKTDVGESRTHQSGILIPVADGRRLFPEPFGFPEGEWFACRDSTGRAWNFKFYHQAKRSESRITHITDYIRQYLIRSGDTITVCRPLRKERPYTVSFTPSDDKDRWQQEGEETFLPEETSLREEGGVQRVWVNRYERDPMNRRAAIQRHGVQCFGCRREMAEMYGKIAKGYIHIHHVKPLATLQNAHFDIKDLVPLCPNCHAIVHLENPPLSIERLKKLIRQQQGGFRGDEQD